VPAEDIIPACPFRPDVVSDGRISVVGGYDEGGFCPRDEDQHSVPSRRRPPRHQPAFWLGCLGGLYPFGCQDPEDGVLSDCCGGVCPELGAPWPGLGTGRSGRNSILARRAGKDMGEDLLFRDGTPSQEKMENVALSLAKGKEVNWLNGQISQFGIGVNTSKRYEGFSP
jgi:hypothetical protein